MNTDQSADLGSYCLQYRLPQWRIQDFWIGGPIYKGGFDLLILPDYFINFFLIF